MPGTPNASVAAQHGYSSKKNPGREQRPNELNKAHQVAQSLPQLKGALVQPGQDIAYNANMSITQKKRLTCFYYYGGQRRVLSNGTFDYVGGVSGATLIEDDLSKEELLSKISSCLNISLDNLLIFHNTKRDKTKYLCVRSDNGVKMLFHLNEDEVDVFVDKDPIPKLIRYV
ncbi:hypothetical protein RHMOL_Rhmol05G0009300 [Rhododendron molle]|uniref:Uncharacterized protein n=1 Tax=Rhododendron molle TaxID=49168 RepID=A0ACC0NKM9_RHOML|nr:hypothetical protein RHMOL_Rhmol05G0009300 [Rhododendron molle]